VKLVFAVEFPYEFWLGSRRLQGKPSVDRRGGIGFLAKDHLITRSAKVDPVRHQELVLKRAALKQARKQDARASLFKSLLSPLDAAGIRYVVIPSAEDTLAGSSAWAALGAFPFDACGHLMGDRQVPASEWRSVFTEQFVSGRRAYLAWKDQDCCIDVLLADLLPVLSEVFIGYHWDSYLFNPFEGWVIESHHDGFLSMISANAGWSSVG
jgi:hypothetical protein